MPQVEVIAGSKAGHGQHRISQEFFTVLDKVARIKADCQVGLVQCSALKTMDNMMNELRAWRKLLPLVLKE